MVLAKQRGTTLLATITVLVIAAVVAASMAAKNTARQRDNDIVSLIGAVEILSQSLDQYYLDHCSASPFVNPTLATLVAAGYLLKPSHVDNQLGAILVPTVVNPQTPAANLLISTNLASASLARMVAAQQAHATATGSQLVWSFRPSLARNAKNTRFVQMRAFFGNATC